MLEELLLELEVYIEEELETLDTLVVLAELCEVFVLSLVVPSVLELELTLDREL